MKWEHFYKISSEGYDCPANVLYEPFISETRDIFMMVFNNNNDYVSYSADSYTDDMVDYFFKREAKYVERFNGKDFAPEVIDVDYSKRAILYKWYDKSLNRGLLGNEFELPSEWQQQVKDVISKLDCEGVFKLNLYPHTFFFDNNGNLRVNDMYGCIDNDDYFISEDIINPVLDPNGGVSNERFSIFTNDGLVNLKKVYDYSLSINYGNWPGDFLNG